MKIDFYSNFLEVDHKYSMISETVTKKLKAHIARHGVPDNVVSDNGPQFAAEEFLIFAQLYNTFTDFVQHCAEH